MRSISSMSTQALSWPACLLGLALGGFFDGILLHQILQWHHLLSNVQAARDMRIQLMADGLFHAAMYVIAIVALCLLWRRRGALTGERGMEMRREPGVARRELTARRALCGHALLGFGAWHALDAVLSHWLTGIHRIRGDVPDPLVWDLIWFFAFGILPLMVCWLVLRRGRDGDGSEGRGHGRGGRAVALSLAIATFVAGGATLLPVKAGDQVVVLFAPWVAPARAFDALGRLDAKVRWVDASGGLWAVRMKDADAAWRVYREGAVLVSSSPLALGCLAWSRPV